MQVRSGSAKSGVVVQRGKAVRGAAQFAFMYSGGRRKGAGRKASRRPDGKRKSNTHGARESFTWSRPVHVTVCVREGLPCLRGAVLAPIVLKAMEAGNQREGFRLVQFSLQGNHWHLICEAEGPAALGAAIKGMNVRIARAINKRLGLSGRVIADRYHLEVLRSPTQVRNALRYVLRNGEKHGAHVGVRHGDSRPCPDPLSSAAWFGYWKEGELNVLSTQSAATIVTPAQGFLLREGLRRMERLSLTEALPASSVEKRRAKKRAKGRVAPAGRALALRPRSATEVPPSPLKRSGARRQRDRPFSPNH